MGTTTTTTVERTAVQRLMHAVRVEAYAVALFDTGPAPLTDDARQRFRTNYRAIAEQLVSGHEASGTFKEGEEIKKPGGLRLEEASVTGVTMACILPTAHAGPHLFALTAPIATLGKCHCPDNDRWWYATALDTGVTLAIKNPRMEYDYDEEGFRYPQPEYDALAIYENGERRDATDEEQDEYGDDVRAYLKLSDFGV